MSSILSCHLSHPFYHTRINTKQPNALIPLCWESQIQTKCGIKSFPLCMIKMGFKNSQFTISINQSQNTNNQTTIEHQFYVEKPKSGKNHGWTLVPNIFHYINNNGITSFYTNINNNHQDQLSWFNNTISSST